MSGRGDINNQIAVFISQLKRQEIAGAKDVAIATATLLARFISARRWASTEEMADQVKELGSSLVAARPHEFTCGNVVRRVLKSIRTVDEAMDPLGADEREPTSSMFGLLSGPEQQSQNASAKARDQKSAIIDEIHELIDEISNNDPLYKTGIDMINDNDVILFPCPDSDTVLELLLKAGQKHSFSVIVTESVPNRTKDALAAVERLNKGRIPATLIPDASVYSISTKVSKVLVSARTVLANGGAIAAAGCDLACRAAKEFNKPVLAIAGTFKLSPLHPFDVSSLIEVGNSGMVINFEDATLMDKLEVINPRFDYIAPEFMDIIVTNDGSYAPNFVYSIVRDNYGPEEAL